MGYRFDFPDRNWRWRIIVQNITYEELDGVARIKPQGYSGILYTTTESDKQEVELLYTLTSPNSVLHQTLTIPGYYRLIVEKESIGTKIRAATGVKKKKLEPVFAFKGYAIISKHKDMIFWHNRFFQIGDLNEHNLDLRDPQEEVKRKHWSDIPEGDADYVPENW